jgi:hypothetical protein
MERNFWLGKIPAFTKGFPPKIVVFRHWGGIVPFPVNRMIATAPKQGAPAAYR